MQRIGTLLNESIAIRPDGSAPNELPQYLVPYLQVVADIANSMDSTNGSRLAPLVPTVLSAVEFGTRLPEGETEVSLANCDVVEAALSVLSRMAIRTPAALQGFAASVSMKAVDVSTDTNSIG